ncbi:MAG: hypothetical protein ACRENN_00430 [Candidatus Eiseniibacteriota bacterium]
MPGRDRPKRRPRPAPGPSLPPWLPPALLVIALGACRLGLGYFWDDYRFLTFQGTGDPRVFLLPDPAAAFYRPIPQSLYYLLLGWIDPVSGLLGHIVNLGVLAATAALFTSLVAKLAGPRVGVITGLSLAAAGCMPSLVTWISGCQDLFAIAFFVLALWLRHRGRSAAAWGAAACAVFSKESVVVLLPLLVLWDVLVDRRPFRVARQAVAYAGLLAVWAAVHPGFQALLAHGFRSGATGYVGLEHSERWPRYFLQYVLTLLNLPITGIQTPWPAEGPLLAVLGLAILVAGLSVARGGREGDVDGQRGAARRGESSTVATSRLWILAASLAILPLLLPSTMIRLWAPYYATLGGLGVSLALGLSLRRAPFQWVVPALAAYLVLGVWCRGLVSSSEPIWSEAIFVQASQAARRVEANFKRLHPTLPGRVDVLALVTATSYRGISSTLLDAQALRVWYRNPDILTLRPEQRRKDAPSEILIRITSNLDVVEIDPWKFRVQWSGDGSPQPAELSRSIRAYARGLAASGRSQDAVDILGRLASVEQGEEQTYDRRLIGMVLLASGRREEAAQSMAGAPSFPYDTRLEIVRKILSEPSTSALLDSCAYSAFELSASDTTAARYLMRHLFEDGLDSEAVRIARRLQVEMPGDPESAAIIASLRGKRRV